MVAIGYARVSTAEQTYQFALTQQVYRLRQAGADKVYADIASRTRDNRAGLAEILGAIARREIKKVLITRLDRLTSSPGLFEQISKVCQEYGVVLTALDEAVDLGSLDGELMAGLSVYLARREVRMIQMRVRKSNQVARENNRASSKAPWGFKSVNGKYELDHTPYLCLLSDRPLDKNEEFRGRTKAELGRDIIDLFFQSGSLYEVTRQIHSKYGIQKFRTEREACNKPEVLVFEDDVVEFKPSSSKRAGVFRWTPGGIRIYLLNPVLCGHTPYHTHNNKEKDGNRNRLPIERWDIRRDTHPDQAIMTDVQVQKIKEILAVNDRVGRWSGEKALAYPLTGIIACGGCGRSMKCEGIKTTSGNRFVYYQCKNYQEKACDQKRMARLDIVETRVIAALIARAAAIAEYASTPPPQQTESAQLQQLRSQLAGLEQLGQNPAIEAAKNDVRSQIGVELAKSQAKEVIDIATQELLLKTFTDPEYWQQLSDADKRQIYRDLVGRVIVRDGQVEKVELRV